MLILHAWHKGRGAHSISDGDSGLPLHYGDLDQECHAVWEGVGIADLSFQGMLRLTGEERVSFLQNMVSNDLRHLAEDQGIFSLLLTPKGKIIADFYLYPVGGALWMELAWAHPQTMEQTLMRYKFRSKVQITQPHFGKILVAGPRATEVMKTLLNREDLPAQEYGFLHTNISGTDCLCVKRSLTGRGDYLLILPQEGLSLLWDRLWDVGQGFGAAPIGQTALETLRIEAGRPRFGVDMNEETLPNEAGLEEAISYDKGCYPGQEVMARLQTYGHVNKHLMSLVMEDEEVPQHGDKIYASDKEQGWVTSAARSPHLKRGVAMGYLRREAATPGIMVEVESHGVQRRAHVASRGSVA